MQKWPAIEFLPFASKRNEVVKLPGQPESYAGAGGPGVSPEGRWILYLHRDPSEARIMLENFR